MFDPNFFNLDAFTAPLQSSETLFWGMTPYTILQLFVLAFNYALAKTIAQKISFRYLHAKKPWLEELLEYLRRPVIFMALTGLSIALLQTFLEPAIILNVSIKLALGLLVMRMVQTAHLSKMIERLLIATLWIFVLFGMTDRFSSFLEALNHIQITLGDRTISAVSVMKAMVVFALFWWIISNTANLLEAELRKRRVKPAARTLLVKILYILGLAIGFFVALDTMGVDLGAFALFGGALGVGLGFGLKAIFSNFLAGFELLMDKTVKPGDVISVNSLGGEGQEIFGQVISMNNRCVIIRQRDGRERMIPNEKILIDDVMNWSYSNKLVRQEVFIRVAHKSDMEKVKEVLQNAAKTVPRVSTMPAPNAFIKEFAHNGTIFFLRFWHSDPEDGVNNIKGDVQMAVWKALKQHGIEIPPPQLRIINLDHLAPEDA